MKMVSRIETCLKNYLDWESDALADKLLQTSFYAKVGYEVKRFLTWRLDEALRYFPVVKTIEKYKAKNSAILEVGSGSAGISCILREKVIGLDHDFKGPKLGYLRGIKGTATYLPFKDGTFDFVISVDMLEHLPGNERVQAISEMIRVSKLFVIIGAPCDSEAEEYEKKFNNLYKGKFGQYQKWLKEHTKNRLPKTNEILSIIKNISEQHGIHLSIRIVKNFNIRFWYLYRIFTMSSNRIGVVAKNKILQPFFPLFKRFNGGKCYRKVFTITKNGSQILEK